MLTNSSTLHKIHNVSAMKLVVLTAVCIAFQSAAFAESFLDDCDAGAVDEKILSEELTQNEKIAKMDKQFYDSITAFAECLERRSAGATSASGEQGGAAGFSTAAQGIEGDEAEISSDEYGEESAPLEYASVETDQVEPGTDLNTETNPDLEIMSSADVAPDNVVANGAVPEDLQHYDNDSALEAQIRRAAMNEPDPILREKLWNQYRKYKKAK